MIRTQWGAGLLSLLIIAGLFACDRKERPQGGKGPGTDALGSTDPSYSVKANVSNIAEIAPKSGTGGADGAEVYARVCSACHQANGQGVPGAFPPLDGSPYVTSNNVERLASILLYGLKGPITVKGIQYNSLMLAQRSVLTDEELAAVATYIRTSWSNKVSGVEAAVFTKLRQTHAEREQFTIDELGVEP